jgi:hypothetical protein
MAMTARRETYDYAASIRKVIATTHWRVSLGRRDFTVNALAVKLDSSACPTLKRDWIVLMVCGKHLWNKTNSRHS